MLVHILFAYIHFGFLGVYFWSIFSCPILTCAAESRSHFWYHYYWWKIVKMSPNISTLTKSKDRWIGTCSNKAKSSYSLIVSKHFVATRYLYVVIWPLLRYGGRYGHKELIISLWEDMVLNLNENRSKYCVCEKYWGIHYFLLYTLYYNINIYAFWVYNMYAADLCLLA